MVLLLIMDNGLDNGNMDVVWVNGGQAFNKRE